MVLTWVLDQRPGAGAHRQVGAGGAVVTDFFGKYRGIVTDNMDPQMIGRIRARVPDVMGEQESGWGMPCAHLGGSGMGFFSIPEVGSGVRIKFERGDPDYPIWSGCWWGPAAEMPPTLLAPSPPSGRVMPKNRGGAYNPSGRHAWCGWNHAGDLQRTEDQAHGSGHRY